MEARRAPRIRRQNLQPASFGMRVVHVAALLALALLVLLSFDLGAAATTWSAAGLGAALGSDGPEAGQEAAHAYRADLELPYTYAFVGRIASSAAGPGSGLASTGRALLQTTSTVDALPAKLTATVGTISGSSAGVKALQTKGAACTGSQDCWEDYVAFYSGSTQATASDTLIQLDLPAITDVAAQTLSALQFSVAMRGPDGGWITWVWEVQNQATKAWVKLGDNTVIPPSQAWTWVTLDFAPLAGSASQYLLKTGTTYSVIIRQTCITLKADAITIDYMRVRFQSTGDTSGTSTGSSSSSTGTTGSTGTSTSPTASRTVPAATSNDVLSRALVVTSSANADSYKGVRMNLWNFGIAFDTVTVPLSPALVLTDPATGLPRYSLIVFAAGSDVSALTSAQRAALDAYELKHKIRRVVFYSNPSLLSSAASGIGAVTSSPSTANTQVVANPAAVGASAVSNGGGMLFTGSYPSYRASIPASSAFKPFMFFGSTGGQPAAGLVTLGDGRQQMHFFFTITEIPFGDIRVHFLSSYVANLWIPWATRGAYVGMRRLLFSMQIDDLGFANPPFKGGSEIRNTPADLQFMRDMQASIRSAFSANGDSDDFRAEWAYNGGQFCAPKYGDQYACQGMNPAGAEYKAQLYEDPLFVAAQSMKDDFFWLSHTWDHETMTSLTYDQASAEFSKNVEFAKSFFGSDQYPTHSRNGLVPPSLSGVESVNVFRARQANAIFNVVHDEVKYNNASEPPIGTFQRGQTFSLTNFVAVEDELVMPRWNALPWHAYDTADYQLFCGQPWQTCLENDATRAAFLISTGRRNSFMLHTLQTVTFTLNGQRNTLYALFARAVIDKLHRIYSGLPIKTLKHDDVFQLAREQRAREYFCGLDARLRMENGAWTGVLLSSKMACRVPVTMGGLSAETLAQYAGAVSEEQYGVERTAWVDLEAGVPVLLKFASQIAL